MPEGAPDSVKVVPAHTGPLLNAEAPGNAFTVTKVDVEDEVPQAFVPDTVTVAIP